MKAFELDHGTKFPKATAKITDDPDVQRTDTVMVA